MHDEKLYAERALRAGASGYVQKQEPPEVVLQAIREILAGRVYLSRAMSDRFLHQMVSRGTGPSRTPLETLSDRELEVLDLLGSGLNTSEIAVRLNLSKKTIQSHRERLKAKLRLKGASELVGYAVARHLDKV
jgi:DNA-binding NarL/FixJ family response regulator